MTTQVMFSCTVATTDAAAPLGFEIWCDDQQVYNVDHVVDTLDINQALDAPDGEHELRLVLKNKLPEHTTVNESGEIVKDAHLTINNICFEEIALGQIVVDKSTYSHDYNGTQAPVVDKFYGGMGCNGVVSLRFSTPIYLWLLESM